MKKEYKCKFHYLLYWKKIVNFFFEKLLNGIKIMKWFGFYILSFNPYSNIRFLGKNNYFEKLATFFKFCWYCLNETQDRKFSFVIRCLIAFVSFPESSIIVRVVPFEIYKKSFFFIKITKKIEKITISHF